MTDADLLRHFAAARSEAAFAELVHRRIDLVYAAALRQLAGDHHRAKDVTQEVFLALARKARSLVRHPDLTGWLYTSTHYAALKLIRSEQRRRRREEAHAMNDAPATHPVPAIDWTAIRSAIDSAMHDLSERDRQIVLLRYFEQHSFGTIAGLLGLSENATQKSAERALDRLHGAFSRRGITSTSAALSLGLSTHLASAAPVGLAAIITQASLVGVVSAAAPTLFVMTATKVGLSLAAAVAAIAIGFVIYERTEKNRLASDLARQEANVAALRAESTHLHSQLAAAEQRAQDADKEAGLLLKAVDDVRTARMQTSAAPAPEKPAQPPKNMSREEALAAIETWLRDFDAQVRAQPGYRPYHPPSLALRPPDEQER